MKNQNNNQGQDFKIDQIGQAFNRVFDMYSPKKVVQVLIECVDLVADHLDDNSDDIKVLNELIRASVLVLQIDTVLKHQSSSTSHMDSILDLDRQDVLKAIGNALLKSASHGDA